MDAREYLESYAALKMEVRMSEDRILEVFNDALIPAMKQGDGSQRTAGAGGRQEKANIRYIETKDRLQPKIDANKAKMRQIDAMIDSLDNPLYREVLCIRYTDATSWDPVKWRIVAAKMYGTDDEKNVLQVQRICRRALSAVGASLDGKILP